MARTREKEKRTRNTTLYIDEDIYERLNRYVYVERRAKSITEVINRALREYLYKEDKEEAGTNGTETITENAETKKIREIVLKILKEEGLI